MPAKITNKIYNPWASGAQVPYIVYPLIPSQITISGQAGVPSFTDGWVPLNFMDPQTQGGKAIKGEYLNGLLNMMTQYLSEFQNGRYPPWDSTIGATGYSLGARVDAANGTGMWLCTVDGNTTNPDTGGTGWVLIGNNTDATNLTSGTLPAARLPAFSGDVSSTAGTAILSLAAINADVGTFGNATNSVVLTADATGRITSISSVAISIPVAQVSGAESTANKGVANGYASLDSTGAVPLSQMPAGLGGAWNFKGLWDANANNPALASGTGSNGEAYRVSTAGTTALDGISDWQVGDWAVFAGVQGSGGAWAKLNGATGEVISVAGKSGAVTLVAGDITITGDATSTSGSSALTLASVNTNIGYFGSASQSLTLTLDAKGRVTAATVNNIQVDASAIISGTIPLTRLPAQTGTGDIVLSDSPTLTGTVTAEGANLSGAVSVGGQFAPSGGMVLTSYQTGAISTAVVAPPGAPTVATAGAAGTSSYSYAVSAVDNNGAETEVGTTTSITTGNSTLSGTNYNVITLPALPAGAVSLNLYRISNNGGVVAGKIGIGLAPGSVINDTGQSSIPYLNTNPAPRQNRTGGIAVPQSFALMKLNHHDPSTYHFFEDFSAITSVNNIYTGGQSIYAEHTLGAAAIGYSTGLFEAVQITDGNHKGVVQLGNLEATVNHGCSYYIGTSGVPAALITPTSESFDLIGCFNLSPATNAAFYFGLINPAASNTIPSAATDTFVGIRFDTAVGDTGFMPVSSNGTNTVIQTALAPVDSEWHRFRVRGDGSGTIYVSLDDGIETALNVDIPATTLAAGFMVQNNAAVAFNPLADYFGLQIFNLSR